MTPDETPEGAVRNALTILLYAPHRTNVGTRIVSQKDFATVQRLLEHAILRFERVSVA